MLNLSVTKISLLGIVCTCLTLITSNAIIATPQIDNWLDEPISISFQNEPLSNILKQISEKTGVSIAYDQKLANEKVTGNYQNVKTSDAITRLFKSKNISIQVNTEKKVIIVKTFGAKNFIWAGTMQGQNGRPQMSLAELEKMHAQQYSEYKKRIANENEVLEGGMTRGEILAMQKQQYKDYQAQIDNDNKILKGDITLGKVRDMHEQQYKEYQTRLANDNEKFAGGKTRGEISAMHQKQYEEYEASLKDDNTILKKGGMTRGELRAMHEKQYNELQREL